VFAECGEGVAANKCCAVRVVSAVGSVHVKRVLCRRCV